MKRGEILIIDDPADHEALRAAHVIPRELPTIGVIGTDTGTDHGAVIRDLTAAETATLGPLTVSPHRHDRAMLVLGRTEPEPAPPPERFHVEADLSLAELRALAYARAALKPRTQVAKDAIAAITRLLGSKVAL